MSEELCKVVTFIEATIRWMRKVVWVLGKPWEYFGEVKKLREIIR